MGRTNESLLDEHLEFEKICWCAVAERDPNELIDLSVRMCVLLDRKVRREIGDSDASGYILPVRMESAVYC